MSKPIDLSGLEGAELLLRHLEAEHPGDIETQKAALEHAVRCARVMLVPAVAERDFSSRPKW